MNSQEIVENYTAREYFQKLISEGELPSHAESLVKAIFGA